MGKLCAHRADLAGLAGCANRADGAGYANGTSGTHHASCIGGAGPAAAPPPPPAAARPTPWPAAPPLPAACRALPKPPAAPLASHTAGTAARKAAQAGAAPKRRPASRPRLPLLACLAWLLAAPGAQAVGLSASTDIFDQVCAPAPREQGLRCAGGAGLMRWLGGLVPEPDASLAAPAPPPSASLLDGDSGAPEEPLPSDLASGLAASPSLAPPASLSPSAAPGEAHLSAPSRPALGLRPGDQAGRELGRGNASWYGPGFHGRPTANGERFDMDELTAAHKTLPFGTRVLVHNPRNGKQVVVRINDRGPFAKGRIIDLSRAAATALGMKARGQDAVVLREIQRPAPTPAPRPPRRTPRL